MRNQFTAPVFIVATVVTLATLVAPLGGQAPSKAATTTSTAAASALRTPWGDPDLQGIWTTTDVHGVPLERPRDSVGKKQLTDQEAAARRERTTQAGIWGYDREWRDTALGFVKTKPSGQVAMVVDPPDGRIPPLTAEAQKRVAPGTLGSETSNDELPLGIWADDLTLFVRCITRGLPNLWMPIGYNNGVQIVQAPGYVVITKEMIHEARVIPLDGRPHLGSGVQSWLGDARGHWEGNTLVIDVTNFNGKAEYRKSGKSLHLIERLTRVDADTIQYSVTIDDPTTWTKPWTIAFPIKKDDSQYELVEYACHEANYGLVNILAGVRAREKAVQGAAAGK